VAVEKGTQTVISCDSLPFRETNYQPLTNEFSCDFCSKIVFQQAQAMSQACARSSLLGNGKAGKRAGDESGFYVNYGHGLIRAWLFPRLRFSEASEPK
jgi:hypothetical protein